MLQLNRLFGKTEPQFHTSSTKRGFLLMGKSPPTSRKFAHSPLPEKIPPVDFIVEVIAHVPFSF